MCLSELGPSNPLLHVSALRIPYETKQIRCALVSWVRQAPPPGEHLSDKMLGTRDLPPMLRLPERALFTVSALFNWHLSD